MRSLNTILFFGLILWTGTVRASPPSSEPVVLSGTMEVTPFWCAGHLCAQEVILVTGKGNRIPLGGPASIDAGAFNGEVVTVRGDAIDGRLEVREFARGVTPDFAQGTLEAVYSKSSPPDIALFINTPYGRWQVTSPEIKTAFKRANEEIQQMVRNFDGTEVVVYGKISKDKKTISLTHNDFLVKGRPMTTREFRLHNGNYIPMRTRADLPIRTVNPVWAPAHLDTGVMEASGFYPIPEPEIYDLPDWPLPYYWVRGDPGTASSNIDRAATTGYDGAILAGGPDGSSGGVKRD